jgi:hypothetical protein
MTVPTLLPPSVSGFRVDHIYAVCFVKEGGGSVEKVGCEACQPIGQAGKQNADTGSVSDMPINILQGCNIIQDYHWFQ